MAYINQSQAPGRRAAAIAGVVAVHGALALGLLSLSVAIKKEVAAPWAPFVITPDPLPTPEPVPVRENRMPQVLDPPRPQPLPPVDDRPAPLDLPLIEGPASGAGLGDGTSVTAILAPPVPAPTALPGPTGVPKAALPANVPARWITNDDYPARALRDEAEGVAGYRVIVGSNGRVSSCEITQSTGNTLLDRATCQLISRRARFEPATNEAGQTILGTYSGRVRWDIPD